MKELEGKGIRERIYWMQDDLPSMKGSFGFGFPSSRQWGRARQITSGLGVSNAVLGNSSEHNSGEIIHKSFRRLIVSEEIGQLDRTWERQQDQQTGPQAAS